jgi:hypothetical protein
MINISDVLLFYRIHASQVSVTSSLKQKEITRKIQGEYWEYCSTRFHIDKIQQEEILKFINGSANVNLDIVDSGFRMLLNGCTAAEKPVAIDNIARVYLRMAAKKPETMKRWIKLNAFSGGAWRSGVVFKFLILRTFGMNHESKFLSYFRKITGY